MGQVAMIELLHFVLEGMVAINDLFPFCSSRHGGNE